MNYEQAKADYNYMVSTYGEPNDLTGGYVEGDRYYDLLANPTKTEAKKQYSNLINYGFLGNMRWVIEAPDHNGGKTIDISGDPEAVRIYKEHC